MQRAARRAAARPITAGARWLRAVMRWCALLACMIVLGLAAPARAAIDPAQGPGGPILVVTAGNADYGKFYAEILRTEGLNAFTVADLSTLTAAQLAAYDVVLLARASVTPTQAALLSTWVDNGGNLIAMAPSASLAPLLGLTATGGTLADGYFLVDTTASPGQGIVGQTLQFHGSATLYTTSGATTLATLYGTASTATANPALTLRSVGNGKAAAFAFDVATSVVQTRQGNPAWATQERDGLAPIRSNDKYYGNAAGDVKPDWVDLTKVAIPQADELQRLLANLILSMNESRKPLPRFWYLPHGKRAAVVMTGDDHGNGGTAGRFDRYAQLSPANCSVASWECIRSTSYLYSVTPLSNAVAAQYAAAGFEVGLHINTGCADFDAASLQSTYTQQVNDFRAKYTSLGPPRTQRHHCIVWSDWTTAAQVQLANGMRLDTSYYYWPPAWVADAPGLFTGSAMPMRFMRLDGTFVDVYQATTQVTDESGQSQPFTIDTLLDRAIGAPGYYGVYTINAHTDTPDSAVSEAVITSALARGVPVVSAQQMLDWLDARGASSFGAFSFADGTLGFTITKDSAANGLQAMLPMRNGARMLASVARNGSPVVFTPSTAKGVDVAFFAADAGSYTAVYLVDGTAPTVTARTPAPGAVDIAAGASVSVTFSEAMTASTLTTTTFVLRDPANAAVAANVTYDAATRTATLKPGAALAPATTYTATLRGGSADPTIRDAAGLALAADVVWSFTTATTPPPPSCPCTGWNASSVPTNPQVSDPNAVELGVKFRVDVDGYVTGVRFYKGSGNTGTHIGNLWTQGGTRLATATFTGETASGWQQVNFAAPVAVTANTVYVASYHAPAGNYAGDNGYFATSGVDNGPVHLLRDGVAGGNGVYQYGGTSAFPSSTYNATNYWVDVVFTATAPADSNPPTITARSPIAGATGVAADTSVGATFNEAMASASIGTSSVELRSATNVLVSATVSYNASTNTAVLVPSAALAAGATYTATVKGGAAGVTDLAGNALVADSSWSFTVASGGGTGPCAAPANPIVAENCLTGNLASEWNVTGIGDPSIQGYATDISVNRGSTVSFKVDTNASNYRFDIYRIGYYGGRGARKVATVTPSVALPQNQPACLTNAATGLVDCGNWAVSGSWAVPANATSGVYIAKLVRNDTGGASHIVFIVRNDTGNSPMLFQTADTTWQAYNNYGGQSFYTGSPAGRAYKVSYNRPFLTRTVDNGQDWFFNAEYPMVRWLEANGYDVSYVTGVDTDRLGAAMFTNRQLFLSVGHDEYWSGAQRANVTAARDAGVNLAFFSGNEVFWKTRWEPSIDASATPYRTLVSYKETHANAKIDPLGTVWTGTWRDPRFSPPADGGRPENELTGTLFMVNDGATTSIRVPAEDGKLRFWRNTSVANLATGTTATLPSGTLGYEWDVDADNASRPAGLMRLSTTTVNNAPVLLDQGSTFGSGTAVHSLTLYRHASGARVFGAGTVQWAWGLDATHDRAGTPADVRMQQATVNLFADMGVQPATLQGTLQPATASTDTAAPTSTITSPATGTGVAAGTAMTISGTATDSGGGVVGGVEVSTDGGTTWRRANGRANWTFAWTATGTGSQTLRSRAVDDSGNLEAPGGGVTVTIGAQGCPCTLFPANAVPAGPRDPNASAVNLGVRFTSERSGFITGIRFYKFSGNGGTHIGSLWTAGGTRLATATFRNETATGWQQVNFTTPVPISVNTVYVASYYAPRGRGAADRNYFANPLDRPPLHAPAGTNGVYRYASSAVFPNSVFQSTNYWVDVVLAP